MSFCETAVISKPDINTYINTKQAMHFHKNSLPL